LGKIVDFNAKSISKAIRTRESILKGDTESWLYTKRKVRQDAISEEDGKPFLITGPIRPVDILETRGISSRNVSGSSNMSILPSTF